MDLWKLLYYIKVFHIALVPSMFLDIIIRCFSTHNPPTAITAMLFAALIYNLRGNEVFHDLMDKWKVNIPEFLKGEK